MFSFCDAVNETKTNANISLIHSFVEGSLHPQSSIGSIFFVEWHVVCHSFQLHDLANINLDGMDFFSHFFIYFLAQVWHTL